MADESSSDLTSGSGPWIEPADNDNDDDDDLISNEEFDRSAAASKILTEDYPLAKNSIYTIEVFMRQKSRRAVYELRDMVDHVSIALANTTTPREARFHLAEAKTHLRRAAIEPYEWMAEKKVLQIEKIAIKGRWLHKFLMVRSEIALDGNDLVDGLREISQLIIDGRVCKATSKSLEYMSEALTKADALLIKVNPKQFHDRVFTACGWVCGGIIGLIIRNLYEYITHLHR
jgi:hypothetical protein